MSTPSPVLVPPSPPPPPLPPAPSPGSERATRVTAVAWIVIVLSALMLPISACSALMVSAGSYGTANTDVLGYVTVVLGPAFMLVCGFGLLRRRIFGYYGVLAVLTVIATVNAWQMATAPTENVTTVDALGVRHTTLGGGAAFLAPFVFVPGVLIAILLTPRARRDVARAA